MIRFRFSIWKFACAMLFPQLVAVSCSSVSDEPLVLKDDNVRLSLVDQYDNQIAISQLNTLDTLRSNMTAYIIENGLVKSIYVDDISTLSPRIINFENPAGSDLFVVYRGSETSGLENIKVGTPKDKLLEMTIDQMKTPMPKSMVMSAVTYIEKGEKNIDVHLKRVYSRLDVKLDGVQVHNIKANGVQTSSYILQNQDRMYNGEVKSISFPYSTPISEDIKGLTYLLEQSAKELTFVFDCSVVGGADIEQVTVQVPFDTIKRNNIYQISLTAGDVPKNITVKFELLPWSKEDVDAGYPDLGIVEIDESKFIVDSKVASLNNAMRTINVTYLGATLRIPFTGMLDKQVTLQDANSNVTLTPKPGTKYENDEVILAIKQPADSPAYSFKINVKNALSIGQGVTYTVIVNKSSYASVVMGNLEWLAVNSGSGKSYPILELGQTIRELYRSNWADFVNMCQWGERPNPTIFLAPNLEKIKVGMDPAGVLMNQAAGLLWKNKVPCPTGWRLPTVGELWRIWPPHGSGVNLSSVTEYSVASVAYTAQIQESGAVFQYSGANQPTKLLVIKQGDNELLFPLAGYRKRDDYNDNSKTPVEVGSSGFYWSNAIGNVTYNARMKGISNGVSWNGDGYNQFELYGSWNMVRCVRDIK